MLKREQCNLRPIDEQDLETILKWRNSERVRANMYTDHIISMAEHKNWFERYKLQEKARYLLFEIDGRAVGLVYFTDLDEANEKAYWGFYLGETDVPKGSGTAMGFLGLDYAFNVLKLRKLCGEAFAFNEASRRFHAKLGFYEEGRFCKHVLKGGEYEDVVSFALFRDQWLTNLPALSSFAFKEHQ